MATVLMCVIALALTLLVDMPFVRDIFEPSIPVTTNLAK
jgi:hypothetical protein